MYQKRSPSDIVFFCLCWRDNLSKPCEGKVGDMRKELPTTNF